MTSFIVATLACSYKSFATGAAVPHLQIEEVEIGSAHDGADRGHRLGRVHRPVAERSELGCAILPLGRVEPHRGRKHALERFVRHLIRLAILEGVLGLCAERGDGLGDIGLRRRGVHSAGTATGWAGTFRPDFAGGTSSPNSFAAVSPRMLRLACSLRKGRSRIELGTSKS